MGGKAWGLVYNSVGTLRAEPKHASEMVTQVLLGMPVRILEQKDEWSKIVTPEGYEGWISGSIQKISDRVRQRYLQQPKVIITSLYAQSFVRMGDGEVPVSDLVAGNILEVVSTVNQSYHVLYPDGRMAFVRKADAKPIDDWLKQVELTGESIAAAARQLLGIPYLWGGTSVKGLDCSGFTKHLFWMHGVILARDASQQVKCGRMVDETGEFADALPGDLLFFGTKAGESELEKVVHVAVYLNNKKYIHASDYVRINSFDPDDTLYDAFNAKRYLRTMRIIGDEQLEGAERVIDNAFYR